MFQASVMHFSILLIDLFRGEQNKCQASITHGLISSKLQSRALVCCNFLHKVLEFISLFFASRFHVLRTSRSP